MGRSSSGPPGRDPCLRPRHGRERLRPSPRPPSSASPGAVIVWTSRGSWASSTRRRTRSATSGPARSPNEWHPQWVTSPTARVIDIGGQSGITGVPEITPAEEIGRVAPRLHRVFCPPPRSAPPPRPPPRPPLAPPDTYKPAVVSAVLEAGADLINDVSGLLYPEVAEQCASAGAGLVIMHNRSRPKQRLTDPFLYDDVVDDVVAFLTERMQQAVDLGVDEESVVLDPGPDFAKTPAQTVEVLRHLDRVMALGRPVLLALSRKDFIGALTLRGPRDRLAGTLAAIGAAIEHRSVILRVHDVADVADFLRVHRVLTGDEQVDPGLTLPVELRRHRRS
ncbi:MAG: dihydropteroate synthase [Microthrixaceae bacterium]